MLFEVSMRDCSPPLIICLRAFPSMKLSSILLHMIYKSTTSEMRHRYTRHEKLSRTSSYMNSTCKRNACKECVTQLQGLPHSTVYRPYWVRGTRSLTDWNLSWSYLRHFHSILCTSFCTSYIFLQLRVHVRLSSSSSIFVYCNQWWQTAPF